MMWLITRGLLYMVDYKTMDIEWVENPTQDDVDYYIHKVTGAVNNVW